MHENHMKHAYNLYTVEKYNLCVVHISLQVHFAEMDLDHIVVCMFHACGFIVVFQNKTAPKISAPISKQNSSKNFSPYFKTNLLQKFAESSVHVFCFQQLIDSKRGKRPVIFILRLREVLST